MKYLPLYIFWIIKIYPDIIMSYFSVLLQREFYVIEWPKKVTTTNFLLFKHNFLLSKE